MQGCDAFGAAATAEAGSWSRYLQDLNRLIAPKLVPDAPLRVDDLAAPYAGRRADEVGEWYLLLRREGIVPAPGSLPPVLHGNEVLNCVLQ